MNNFIINKKTTIILISYILLVPYSIIAQQNKDSTTDNESEITAVKLYESGRYPEALRLFQKGIKTNKKTSLFYLGKSFEEGNGVKPDTKVAVEFYTKAANQGHADAKGRLGIFYITGRGVLQNFKKGITLLKEASALGSKEASLTLGGLYQQGYGVPKDLEESRRYYILSSNRNSPEASYALAKDYENNIGSSKTPQQEKLMAFKYMKKSADLGFPPAYFALANYYKDGIGTEQSKKNAHIYFNLASAAGSIDANKQLEELTLTMTLDEVMAAQSEASDLIEKRNASN